MSDRYSWILYDSTKNLFEDAWKIMKKVPLTALYTSVDAIFFFALCDVILREM